MLQISRCRSKGLNKILQVFRFCRNNTLDADDTQYELFALTVHIGSLDKGHYVAYTKRNRKWYLFNDEDYEPVKELDALN